MEDSDTYVLGDDTPKKNPWRDDRLEMAPFAKRIAKVLLTIRAPNGYVIGLHGKWGTGKSTLVNFIVEIIKKHNQETAQESERLTHIEFRPWMVAGHHDLVASFFKILTESLEPRDTRQQRFLKRALRFLYGTTDNLVDAAARVAITIDPSGGVASSYAGNLARKSVNTLLGRFLEDPSLQRAYEELTDQLQRSKKRYFVTIDDIDRLDRHEAKSIMQMVKTVGRLPNMIYLLAYDREIVWKGLDQDRIGPRFAEKIVQQEIELPQPSRNSLLKILDREIGFLIQPIPDSARWQYIVRDGIGRWINSPRDVLRLSNAIKFAWPALLGEFDPQDLVAMEGLRLFDQHAFDWIRTNRDFLFNEGRFFLGQDEERKENIAALKAKLPEDSSGQILNLLSLLFPHQGKWFEGKRHFAGETSIEARNRRGMATEAGYDSYFSLHPSSDAIPKATVDQLLADLENEETIQKVLNGYMNRRDSRGRHMIGSVLEELRFRLAGRESPNPTQALLNALFSVGDSILGIPWQGELLTPGPRSILRYLIRDMLEAWGTQAGKHLMSAFNRSESIALMAEVFVDRGRELGVFRGESPGAAVLTLDDFDLLGNCLLSKILASAAAGTLSDAPFFWDITRAWQHLGDAQSARDWLNKGAAGSGEFAAKVVRGMVSQSTSSAGMIYAYRVSPEDGMYDVDRIYEEAKRHLDSGNLDADDRNLLRALVEGVEQTKGREISNG